jgi:quinol monooxygenase YgiN
MHYLLVRHTVEDYARWKPFFDGHAATRKAAGCQGGVLCRSADNPNQITLLFEWDDLANARQFAQSQDLRETMMKAGVIGMPDISFLDGMEKFSA